MKTTFENRQRNAVIRVAFYHRFDFEVALIQPSSSNHASIRLSLADPFPASARARISILECLPIEMYGLASICDRRTDGSERLFPACMNIAS